MAKTSGEFSTQRLNRQVSTRFNHEWTRMQTKKEKICPRITRIDANIKAGGYNSIRVNSRHSRAANFLFCYTASRRPQIFWPIRSRGSKLVDAIPKNPNHSGVPAHVYRFFFGPSAIRIRNRDRRSHYDQSHAARANQSWHSQFEAARKRYVRGGKRKRRGGIVHHWRSGTVSHFAAARALHRVHEWQETWNRPLRPVRCRCRPGPDDKGPVGVRHGNSVKRQGFVASNGQTDHNPEV